MPERQIQRLDSEPFASFDDHVLGVANARILNDETFADHAELLVAAAAPPAFEVPVGR